MDPASVRPSSSIRSHIQMSSPLKPLGQSVKFYVEPPWEGGTKAYINGPGHMTKMAATPIYGKNPSKIFSRTDFQETWYVASMTPAHHSLNK